MRVVNDRRRLPRVAWSGNAVIQTRRGELRGVGLDLSADGMAVLAPMAGKAKERIRIHAQLGDFPLLTDARVVRMTKRPDGYRWAIKFERMDPRMRANLEAYVRHQLATAARYRQAQLYAQRLKGGALQPPPPAPPSVSEPRLPTPGPMQQAALEPVGDPSQPLVDMSGVPDAQPAAEPENSRPLEIELPDMGEPQGPALEPPATGPATPDVYVPYHATDANDEAALLGEGPLSASQAGPVPSAPESAAPPPPPSPPPTPSPPSAAATMVPTAAEDPPSAPLQVNQELVAKTFTPGIVEIDDNEDLSLEDILAEVEAAETAKAAPATDLNLPPPQEAKPEVSGLGDVLMMDENLGDDEETRRRDSELPGMTGPPDEDAGTTLRMKEDIKPPPPSARAGGGAPAASPDAVDATVVKGRGETLVPSSTPTLIGRGEGPSLKPARTVQLDSIEIEDEDSNEISLDELAPPPGAADPEPSGAPLLVGAEPQPSGAPLLVDAEPVSDAPALVDPEPMTDAPALADVGPMLDAPALVDPVPMTDAPALVDAGPTVDAPALDDDLDDAPALVGAPIDLDPASSVPGAPIAVEPEPSMSDAPALIEPAPPVPNAVPPEPDAPKSPSLPVPSNPTFTAHPSPFYDGPEEEAEPEIPEPFSDVPASPAAKAEADAPQEPVEAETPAAMGDVPSSAPQNGARGTPLPSSAQSLYGDAEPFDPYAPNPEPPAGSAAPSVGSAPRALGELPPVVQGLYTPTSNPHLGDEPSGAYETASFEPFPSVEEGLYGDRSDVSFTEAQGNPRQRLAMLQADDASAEEKNKEHDLFLGDIEGVTSGLTPTDYKRKLTDEVFDPEPAPAEPKGVAPTAIQGAPDRAEAEPTRPVDVGAEEFTPGPPADAKALTPPPHDLTPPPQQPEFTPAPEELSLDDVEFEEDGAPEPEPEQSRPDADSSQPGFPTYPEFNVIPDFEKAPPPSEEPDDFAPAQTGKTMVASLESLGMLRPPDDDPMPVPSAPPGDFAVLPSFGGSGASQPGTGFAVVAALDESEDKAGTLSGSTMIATAEDIEGWKRAAELGAGGSPSVDDVRTVSYTPPPGTLQPATRDQQGAPPAAFGAPPISEDALTAMRVGRGAAPGGGGAGFQLNPRGPAPAAPTAPATPVGRVPIVQAAVPRNPRPGPTAQPSSMPSPGARPDPNMLLPTAPLPGQGPPASSRPTLPPPTAAPGPSPRRHTEVAGGGRPGPMTPREPPTRAYPAVPAKPGAGQRPQAHPPSSQPTAKAHPVVPKAAAKPVEPAAPAAPATRRTMVEDALAQLKRKTAEKRKTGPQKVTQGVETKPKITKKEAARERRRRRLGAAELTDPALAELYKAAMTDLERS